MDITQLQAITQKYRQEGFLDSEHLAQLKNDFVKDIFNAHTQFEDLSISQQSKIEEAVRELLDADNESTRANVAQIVESLKHVTVEADFDPTGFSLPEIGNTNTPAKVKALRFRTKELILQLLNSGRPEKKQMARKMLSKMILDFNDSEPEHQKEALDIVFELGTQGEKGKLLNIIKENLQILEVLSNHFESELSLSDFDFGVYMALLIHLEQDMVLSIYQEDFAFIDSFDLVSFYNNLYDVFLSPCFLQEKSAEQNINYWAEFHFLFRPPLEQLDLMLYLKADPQFAHLKAYLQLIPDESHGEIKTKLNQIAKGDIDSEQTRLHQAKAERLLRILAGEPDDKDKLHPFDQYINELNMPHFDFDFETASKEAQEMILQLKVLYEYLEPSGLKPQLWPSFETLLNTCVQEQKDADETAPELFASKSDQMIHGVARKSLEAMGSLMVSLEETTLTAMETLSKMKKAVRHIDQIEANLVELKAMTSADTKQHMTLIKHYEYKLKYLIGIKKQLKKAYSLMKAKFPPQLKDGIKYTSATLQKLNAPHAMPRRREIMMNFGYKIYEPLKPGFQLAIKSISQYESVLKKKP